LRLPISLQISSRDHAHLNDLSQLRFVVIDEADRMIQQGSFPQLSQILDAVQRANPMDDEEDESELSDKGKDDAGRMLSLPGILGEAKVTMLSDDILQRIKEQAGEKPNIKDFAADKFEEEICEDSVGSQDEISLPALPPVRRQTFVYSATLTLPGVRAQPNHKKQKGKRPLKHLDGAISEILEKAHVKGETKIVDLSNAFVKDTVTKVEGENKKEKTKTRKTSRFQLPPGLKLQEIKCTQKHKDSHLYAYLLTTIDGSSGPSLVFCNSIAAVRRVGATLQTLGLQVRILHAHMQQVSDMVCRKCEGVKKCDEEAFTAQSSLCQNDH
jgi:ATP-dependent RNA helicase DDX24/MAK5